MDTTNRAAIERLYEDETLTKGLDDAPARALLKWGQAQLEQGRLAEAVRREMKTLAQVIRDREGLTPEEAALRLSAAGLSLDEKGLSDLWEQMGGNETDWVNWLLTLVRTSPLLSQDTAEQLNAPPPPVEEYPTPEEEATLNAPSARTGEQPTSQKETPLNVPPEAVASEPPPPPTSEQVAPRAQERSAVRRKAHWWQFWRR